MKFSFTARNKLHSLGPRNSLPSYFAHTLFSLFFVLFATWAGAQTTVTGTVSDDTGETLIGVNILIKGTASGTVTDFDGTYTLDVPAGSETLVFSYTGYQPQEINLAGRTLIDIVMSTDAEILDEVVVIGYGVVRKSDLTGSVASLDGGEITGVVAGNPTSALQGKLAGVQVENNGGQPGGASNVFVRGVSSLTNSFPLYVVDGTIVENMNFINPKDIESIEVLKDASAAAIYGSRAANGVVLISTKRGENDSRPTVSLDIRAGIETPSKMLDFLDGPQFVQYRNQLEQNDGTGFVFPSNVANTDWQDLSLNSGAVQDYGLSVSGGGQDSRYFISANAFEQDGVLVGSGFERLNFRANSEFKLGRFTISESLSMTQAERQDNNWFGFDAATAPILRESVPGNDGGFEAPSFDIHNFGGTNNYAQAVLEDNSLTTRNVLGNLSVSYDLAEGLTAKVSTGIDYRNDYSFFFVPTFNMSTSDPVFNVNQLNDLTENRSENLLTLIEPTLRYDRDFGNSRLYTVVGFTQQKIDFRNLVVYSQGLPNNDIQVTGAASPANVQALAGFNNVSVLQSVFGRVNYSLNNRYLVSATVRRDASSKFAEANRVGYFPSVSLGWNISNEPFWSSNTITRLKLRAGYGELGSQNIPDYAYQSVFNLTSNTSFNDRPAPGYAQTSLALDNIVWETSRTTNIGLDVGLLNDQVTFSLEYYTRDVDDVLVGVNLPSSVGFSEPVIQNVGTFSNSGFEFEALYRKRGKFNYNIGVNFSTFNSEVTSLPNPIVGPSTSEDLTRVNRFIEGAPPGVYWGFIVDGVYADQAAIDSDPNIADDPTRRSVVQPGDFIRRDINDDGKITVEDQTILGDPTPDFTYGINFSGDYGNLDFGVFFQGVQGNEIYNLNKFYNIFWSDGNKLTDVLNSWTPSNTNTDIPRATTLDQAENRAPSSFFVEDGSYFRLRTLEVGYTIGTDNVDWISNVRVFLIGQNLLTLTGYSGYDPDISSTNGGRSNRDTGFTGYRLDVNPLLGRGLDARAYPNTRSFVFGLQANF
ncbi:MAG: TonB-dependent receptor [Bacteroidota bacterium]